MRHFCAAWNVLMFTHTSYWMLCIMDRERLSKSAPSRNALRFLLCTPTGYYGGSLDACLTYIYNDLLWQCPFRKRGIELTNTGGERLGWPGRDSDQEPWIGLRATADSFSDCTTTRIYPLARSMPHHVRYCSLNVSHKCMFGSWLTSLDTSAKRVYARSANKASNQ